MTFFTKVTKPSKGTQETMEKKHVCWSKGLKGTYTHSEVNRARISAAQRGKTPWNKGLATGPNGSTARCKPIMTPKGLFSSRKEAVVALGVSTATIAYWMEKSPEHYYYINKGE